MKIEVPTTSFLAAARNQLYCEPFDEFDPHKPARGKKIFNENFRPVRNNLNLEIKGDAVDKYKKKLEQHIDTKADLVVAEKYKDLFNQKKMRDKHRNVSYDSSLHPLNKPPLQYLEVEKILEKPCKIDFTGMNTTKIPLAGKLSLLGAKIMADPIGAKHLTTGPWDMVQKYDHEPRAINGKKPKPIAEKLGRFDISAHQGEVDNFQILHRKFQPQTTIHSSQPIRFEMNGLNESNNETIFKQRIREDLSRSPKGVVVSDSRLSYLVKAKMERKTKYIN